MRCKTAGERAIKHGHYSAEAKAIRRKARLHLKALRRLIGIAEQLIEMAPPAAEDVAPVELAHAHITGAKNA